MCSQLGSLVHCIGVRWVFHSSKCLYVRVRPVNPPGVVFPLYHGCRSEVGGRLR